MGTAVGASVGVALGAAVGAAAGTSDGADVGAAVGATVGTVVGASEGVALRAAVCAPSKLLAQLVALPPALRGRRCGPCSWLVTDGPSVGAGVGTAVDAAGTAAVGGRSTGRNSWRRCQRSRHPSVNTEALHAAVGVSAMERQWELLSARKEDAVDATVGAQAGVALVAALMAFAWHCPVGPDVSEVHVAVPQAHG